MAIVSGTKDWLKNLPNKLTLLRIALIPLLLVLYPLSPTRLNTLCAAIFTAAALTDLLDGYLARKYQNVTALGALLDPIADKMLIAAALVLLAYSGAVPVILAALLICRDIAVNGIRMLAMEQQVTIAVSDFGKWKTALTLVAIVCLFVNEPLLRLPVREVGMVTLWLALALSLYSGWLYGRGFLQNAKLTSFT